MRAPGRSRLLPLVALLACLAAFPLGVVASHQFADVPNSNPFHADISALADSGVTTGCGGGNYCPSAYVTREQMAAFMNRLGALQAGKVPVVNADRLDGMDSTDFLPGATIVTHHQGWLPDTTSTAGIETLQTGDRVIAMNDPTAATVLRLDAPSVIGTVDYALASVQICMQEVDANGYLDLVIITASDSASSTNFLSDGTNHLIVGSLCVTYTVATPTAYDGPISVWARWDMAGDGHKVFIWKTEATWVPA